MDKCDCYDEREECISNCPPTFRTYGVCLGTKEIDRCSCGADPSKCNFYESVRKKAKKTMNTAEMYLAAKENGKTYMSNDVDAIYNKMIGLVEKDNIDEEISLGDFPTFEYLMKSEWVEINVMTKAEAEKKFGIKIVG